MSSRIKLFAGNSNIPLAERMAKSLFSNLSSCKVTKFQDSEINVQIFERVRNDDVFLIQSTSNPANDHLMELVIMVDALRRASAGKITAIVPYFGYARQDRRVRSLRVPITARLVADILGQAGIDRIVTVDLHAEQIQGFFKIPVDNVYATGFLVDHMRTIKDLHNPIVVSPDIGGVVRARATAKLLDDTDIAIIDKRRPSPNVSEVMNIIGEVADRDCILVDDIIDTGGTLINAANALKERGARRIFAYATHGVFSGSAFENLQNPVLEKVVVTDTIELSEKFKKCGKIEQVSLDKILAEVIRRINLGQSINDIYDQVDA